MFVLKSKGCTGLLQDYILKQGDINGTVPLTWLDYVLKQGDIYGTQREIYLMISSPLTIHCLQFV